MYSASAAGLRAFVLFLLLILYVVSAAVVPMTSSLISTSSPCCVPLHSAVTSRGWLTSSARRRARIRCTAVRHAQLQSLTLKRLLVSRKDEPGTPTREPLCLHSLVPEVEACLVLPEVYVVEGPLLGFPYLTADCMGCSPYVAAEIHNEHDAGEVVISTCFKNDLHDEVRCVCNPTAVVGAAGAEVGEGLVLKLDDLLPASDIEGSSSRDVGWHHSDPFEMPQAKTANCPTMQHLADFSSSTLGAAAVEVAVPHRAGLIQQGLGATKAPLDMVKAPSEEKPIRRSCLKKEKSDDHALVLRAAAERRLKATAREPKSVQRVKQIVDDFDLGIKVEAAMLLMSEDPLTRLVADEAEFRRRISALPPNSRRQKVLWLIDICDEAVVGLLPFGMEILATMRA